MQNQNNNINNNEEDFSQYYPDGDAANIDRDDHDDSFLNKNRVKKMRNRKKNARLTKGQITLIVIAAVLCAAIIFAIVWVALYKPNNPGGTDIPFDTNPIVNGDDPDQTDKNDPNNQGHSGVNSDTYNVKEGIYNILVVGHDDAAHLADVTMIVNCNTVDKTISIMQIPRDTLVTISTLYTNKTNEAFSSYYIDAYRAGKENPYQVAMDDYATMLEKSLCINIHHTVKMNLAGFRGIVDAIEGIDVYVPDEMYYEDPEQDLYISIPAGYQHLDGATAEGFVRFRSGYVQADLGRVNAQKIFLTAMFNKVKATIKSADVTKITALANEVFDNVTTDLTISDIVYYAKFLMDVDLESINMMTMPGNLAGSYYVMNRAATLKVINQYFNIYTKEITDSIFDRNYLFCFVSKDYICDVYFDNAENVLDEVHNAGDIDDGEMQIPTLD
ncbi:MAG: LytR family transcriptional regulator [Ruminococcaceae bacterium]|nr:LytR family transcriptional regulator [Oscillospiraceae bacterium]